MKQLTGQFDLKYWPGRADIVQAIAEFEEVQPEPSHCEYPDNVINGRESDIKDLVLAFDSRSDDEANDLPADFRFTNNAMADIANVVLDLPVDKLVSGEAVRVVRNRFAK